MGIRSHSDCTQLVLIAKDLQFTGHQGHLVPNPLTVLRLDNWLRILENFNGSLELGQNESFFRIEHSAHFGTNIFG